MITVEKIVDELTKTNNGIFVFTPEVSDDIIIKRYKLYKHNYCMAQNRRSNYISCHESGFGLFMKLLDSFDIKYAINPEDF